MNTSIHPSIHLLPCINQEHMGLVPNSCSLWVKVRVLLKKNFSPSESDTGMYIHANTPNSNLRDTNQSNSHSLVCGRSSEYLQKTQRCTGRTCKLLTQKYSRSKIELRTFFLQGINATNCARVKIFRMLLNNIS